MVKFILLTAILVTLSMVLFGAGGLHSIEVLTSQMELDGFEFQVLHLSDEMPIMLREQVVILEITSEYEIWGDERFYEYISVYEFDSVEIYKLC